MLSIFIIHDILLQQSHTHSTLCKCIFSWPVIILVNQVYQRSTSLSAIGRILAVWRGTGRGPLVAIVSSRLWSFLSCPKRSDFPRLRISLEVRISLSFWNLQAGTTYFSECLAELLLAVWKGHFIETSLRKLSTSSLSYDSCTNAPASCFSKRLNKPQRGRRVQTPTHRSWNIQSDRSPR